MKTKAQLDMTDVKSLLNLFGDEEFFLLFKKTLEVYCSTSAIDFWHQLFYEAANNFLGELQKESRAHQATISSSNQVLAQLDDHSMEIEILEKPKHQSPVVPPVIQTTLNVQTQPYTPREKKHVTYAEVATSSGSSSDDSRPMSLFPKDKRNTQ
ncbi:hypothetical protein RhiirA4_425693 [Rhizophagus irregularis]|uniref:Uncharacterized protein n=1 Tax=Rhizophagus irregularis TaxID=588596 RepID=A0A2I1H281_9GLOM|nr:hypothetical protein RhiirA4_425693 [Rhizophagus irregularis]